VPKKHLKPIFLLTLALLGALLVELALLRLASWQWQRYQQRLAENAAAAQRAPDSLQGTYLPVVAALTNQPNPASPEESGWRVLGLLATEGRWVVVDRGFTPALLNANGTPNFSQITAPIGPQVLQGFWSPLPKRKGWLGGPDVTTHPQLLAFLNPNSLLAQVQDASATAPLASQQFVLASPDTTPPVLRAVAPPLANPLRHLSYCIQWLTMAALFPLLCWGAWRRSKRPKTAGR
jgi:cytochrome oxidase assembly protein ShyY1